MVVIATFWIEWSTAINALITALQIFTNSHFGSAGTAQNCFFFPVCFRPHFKGMIGEFDVTVFTGIVGFTTFHLDRDDIGRTTIVTASRLQVEIDPTYCWMTAFFRCLDHVY